MGTTVKMKRDRSSANKYRNDNVRAGIYQISSEGSDVSGWNIINPNSSPVYLKFVDATSSGTITIGSSVIEKTLLIPALTTVIESSNVTTQTSQCAFDRGINFFVTTLLPDNDTSTPLLACMVEIFYTP